MFALGWLNASRCRHACLLWGVHGVGGCLHGLLSSTHLCPFLHQGLLGRAGGDAFGQHGGHMPLQGRQTGGRAHVLGIYLGLCAVRCMGLVNVGAGAGVEAFQLRGARLWQTREELARRRVHGWGFRRVAR